MRGSNSVRVFAHKIGESVAEHSMWSRGMRVAVAVSGGIDSVVLLETLIMTQRWHGGLLEVVTVNHGTRQDSAQDADFVCSLATKHGLVFHRRDYSLGPDASEEQCRDARFEFFDNLLSRRHIDRVVLGHHMNDQAETVLLNLIRGTGVTGRAAMLPVRGKYVRPMLNVSRQGITEWATKRNVEYREDPSNADPKYSRNRIRNEVMPLLEDIRQGATKSLATSAKIAADDKAAIDSMVEKAHIIVESDCGSILFGRGWAMRSPDSVLFGFLNKHVQNLTYNKFDPIKKMVHRGYGILRLSPLAQLRVNKTHVTLERT